MRDHPILGKSEKKLIERHSLRRMSVLTECDYRWGLKGAKKRIIGHNSDPIV